MAGCAFVTRARPGSEDGFTLLEVLVAAAILALGLASFYQAFGVGLRAEATAERQGRAVAAAENLLAELGRTGPLQDGTAAGRTAGWPALDAAAGAGRDRGRERRPAARRGAPGHARHRPCQGWPSVARPDGRARPAPEVKRVRDPAGEAGLTLVEMLVVLAVLGLMVGLLTGGLRSAAQGWRGIVRHDAEGEELRTARDLVRRALSQAYPAATGDAAHRSVRFEGGPASMEFLAPLPQRFGAEDIARHALGFPGDGTLRMSWRIDRRPGVADVAAVPGGAEEVLDGIVNGSFSYFGPAGRDEEPRWWSTWKERPWLPSLARIRFRRGGRTEELVVAPLVTAAFCLPSSLDAACLD